MAGSARAQENSPAGAEPRPALSQPGLAPAPSTLWTVDDTVRRRHAVKFSDGYYTRLDIHRIGSYTMLPLFAGEYALGQKLLNGTAVAGWVKPAHLAGAVGISGLFAINTVTGVWNLKESWHEPQGRLLRLVHSGLMLASEVGMVYTETLANGARRNPDRANQHKRAAIVSMSLATAGTALMWFVKH
jgi:hypothetical protein